jgi:hypothetical protein
MKARFVLLSAAMIMYTSISVLYCQDTQLQRLRMLNKFINAPFAAAALEKERDGTIASLQNPVKDEFETQQEFEARKASAARKAQELRSEYDRKIADAQLVHQRRIDELKREREDLLDKSAVDVASIFTLGTFDAEKEEFPITMTVDGSNYRIRVPRSTAKEFKQRAGTLLAPGKRRLALNGGYEYYNWRVDFSAANASYAFGPQRGTGTISTEKKNKEGLPPALTATVDFKESSGNLKLDAEEKGTITVTLSNSGKGSALGVEATISLENASGISVPASVYIGEIPPGQTRTGSVMLTASEYVQNGTATAMIGFKEVQGFAPVAKRLSFETKALTPPKLEIADFGIEDNNKNGKIEPGEIVKLIVRIQNTGLGDARNVRGSFTLGKNVFIAENTKTEFSADDLASGAYYDASFKFYTNNEATAVPITVSATESRGKYGVSNYTIPLAFNKQLASIEDIRIKGKDESAKNVAPSKGLSVDIEQDIPRSKNRNDNALAVIIGIEQYSNVAGVSSAKRDAEYFKEYAVNILGIPDTKNNIYMLTDEKATKGEFLKIFDKDGWLAKRASSKSDIFIYYAGHGAPDVKTKSAFLLPYDGDPNYASSTGYSLSEMFNGLSGIKAQSINVFLDACFSGATRENKMLLADARPVFITVENPLMTSENAAVFSASSGTQISSGYPEKKHGLFTYFLLKGLRGDADANSDKNITLEELGNYVRENVSRTAGTLDREQTPELKTAKPGRVLVKY